MTPKFQDEARRIIEKATQPYDCWSKPPWRPIAPSLCEALIAEAIEQTERKAREECAKLAVRRMTYWTEEDDKQPYSFRFGIEKACSDLAKAIRQASRREKSNV